MLPNLNLDDRTYKEILDRARQSIHRLDPDWTDENTHDPGITMIELFAYITEAQQYYINRVTARNELKFLKLLGVIPESTKQAYAEIQVSGVEQSRWLSEGTILSADRIDFETTQSLYLLPQKIERVVVQEDADSIMHAWEGIHSPEFYLFGNEAKQDSRFYIGLDSALPSDIPLHITFDLVEDDQFSRNAVNQDQEHIKPPVQLEWSYFGEWSEGQYGWNPLTILTDYTRELTFDGSLYFQLTERMVAHTVYPAVDIPRYWIRCVLHQSGYETPPILKHLLLNTIQAREGHTAIALERFDHDGSTGAKVQWLHRLAQEDELEVRIREQNGWHIWHRIDDMEHAHSEERCYVVKKMQDGSVCIHFGDGNKGKVPSIGKRKIMLIAWEPSFRERRYIGQSNGMPVQHYRVASPGEKLAHLRIQVGTTDPSSNEMVWHHWQQVEDLDSSGSEDRHFQYDEYNGEIRFGDNEKGMIPAPAPTNNICLIAYTSGGGERGNIKNNTLTLSPQVESSSLQATNYRHGYGGQDAETLDQAKRRLSSDLHQINRAVTASDYEQIALRTPGLRVASVKALPLYVSGLVDYPNRKAAGQITLVVVPYGKGRPEPSPAYLHAVKQHMEQYRLLGTQLHVIGPQYMTVNIQAQLVVEPYCKNKISLFTDVLEKYFDPLRQQGEFGKSIRSSQLHNLLSRVPGVIYVQDVWIHVEGTGAKRDESGNVSIPPNGLAAGGDYNIELFTPNEIR